MIDKARTMFKFMKLITEILDSDPEYHKRVGDDPCTYLIKVVDEIGSESSKFSLGFNGPKLALLKPKNPDVIVVMTETAFFSILRNKMTLEEAYFSNEVDLSSRKGSWVAHVLGIKNAFDSMKSRIYDKLNESGEKL